MKREYPNKRAQLLPGECILEGFGDTIESWQMQLLRVFYHVAAHHTCDLFKSNGVIDAHVRFGQGLQNLVGAANAAEIKRKAWPDPYSFRDSRSRTRKLGSRAKIAYYSKASVLRMLIRCTSAAGRQVDSRFSLAPSHSWSYFRRRKSASAAGFGTDDIAVRGAPTAEVSDMPFGRPGAGPVGTFRESD